MTHAIPNPTLSRSHVGLLVGAMVAAWFLLALAGSLLGVFDRRNAPPLALAAAATLPVIAFGAATALWPAFRALARRADARLLTIAQAWRVGGIVFVILHARGLLPGEFALPAGWGDIAIGVTAPLVALGLRRGLSRSAFVLWNVLGILDLVMAVTLGALASPALRVLGNAVTTEPMGQFPLSLIPTFFVPMFVILHIVAMAGAGASPVAATRRR